MAQQMWPYSGAPYFHRQMRAGGCEAFAGSYGRSALTARNAPLRSRLGNADFGRSSSNREGGHV